MAHTPMTPVDNPSTGLGPADSMTGTDPADSIHDAIRPRDDAELRMAGYLAKVATGPELSKDLVRDDARDGMEMILRGQVDAAQAAVFLIALRMKRESHDELCGVLDALRAVSVRAVADVDHLVDLADPYNGFVRHAPAVPFVPAVLAACGVPCVIHGIREVGPKWGLTPHRILRAAGVASLDQSPDEAARHIAESGWAYIDQTRYCPGLAGLARLRTLIVKRPCLSLLEKLINPIRSRGQNHLWVGFAHRGYPEILGALAREFGYDSMLAVRGVESGVLTSLTGNIRGARYADAPGSTDAPHQELESIHIAAREVIEKAEGRAPALPPEPEVPGGSARPARPARPDPATLDRWAAASAERGQDALAGAPGATRDMLVLGAAAILRHLGRVENLAEGAAQARSAIDAGEARRRFQAMCDAGQ